MKHSTTRKPVKGFEMLLTHHWSYAMMPIHLPRMMFHQRLPALLGLLLWAACSKPAVPSAAVVGIGEDAQVIARKAHQPVPVPVKVIAISGAEAIVDGLAAELEVAAEGQRLLLGAR